MTCEWHDFTRKKNSYDLASNLDESYLNEAAILNMKNLGFNAVDMHMILLGDTTNPDGSIKESFYINFIDKMAEYCQTHEMYLIINWHRFNPYESLFNSYGWFYAQEWFWEYGEGRSKPTSFSGVCRVCIDFYKYSVPKMNQARQIYLEMLEYTANRYKNNPWVHISPRNEPQHFIYKYTTSEAEAQEIVDGYYELHRDALDRMRATGWQGLMFLEVPYGLLDRSGHYYREDDMQDIQRDGVVYEFHDYIRSGTTDLSDWKLHIGKARDNAEAFGYPFYLGEWHYHPADRYMNLTSFENTTQAMLEWIDAEQFSDAIHSHSRFYGYFNWQETSDNSWNDNQRQLYENLQLARPSYILSEDENNGGGEEIMSFNYKNDDAEPQTYKIMVMQLVEIREEVIQPGETKTINIDVAAGEILVRPNQ
jgi:hypothetical protein